MPTEQPYVFRTGNRDGSANEVEMTAEQAGRLAAGAPIAYFPRDQRVAIDASGTIVHRESAISQPAPPAH